MDEKTLKRFWVKVNKNGTVPAHRPDLGKCWVWDAAVNRAGYGWFKYGNRPHLAHRVSWLIQHGSFSENEVLHRCDNPACVRVSHLFEGTQADNVRDMVAKGRHVSGHGARVSKALRAVPGRIRVGEENTRAVLNRESVVRIRALYGTLTLKDIAARFGVTVGCISAIIYRKSWKHV